MRTKTAVIFEHNKSVIVDDLQLDAPKAKEVLVRMNASGVCHSDLSVINGTIHYNPPVVLGHEGAGVGVDTGAGVTSVKKGDHVLPLYTPECRQCDYCTSGRTNLCQAIRETQGQGLMPDETSRLALNGDRLFHYMGTSTFSNYTVLPEIAVAKIREDAPFH